MVSSGKLIRPHIRQGLIAAVVLMICSAADVPAQVTNIAVGSAVLQPSVKRFGMNLSNEDFYDGGQMTKSLVFRNPGFEGEIYQSTIRCSGGTATTCVDEDAYSAWPTGFWNGATFEIFYGASQGRTGTVSGYGAAQGASGGTFTFSNSGVAPAAGDYMIVRMTVPGNAAAGWWPATSGNGAITTNTSDLPPGTTGLQTAAVNATAASDSAALTAYFDSDAGRSFVLLNGTFQLSFKAKGIGGSNAIALNLQRIGLATYLNQTVSLTNTWSTYTFNFSAAEAGSALNAVSLTFRTVGQDSFLLDDVNLTQTNSDPSNVTAFRDPVVSTLETLHPGVLRFWAGQLGDTLDNLIADPYGRQRSGYLAWYTEQDDISYGLQEFLQLCESIGAEPWFVVPSTFSTSDASHLIEYLAGASSTPYGAKRAARGHANPWTSSFGKIHLEFGNEAWNGSFKGGSIEYPQPYGQRAQAIFGAMQANGSYSAAAFDLVLGGQAVSAGRNQDIQNNCNNNDSFAVAPYMMNTVDSFSSNEDLFGSTFAEPEAYVSPNGVAEGVSGGLMTLNQQAIQASSHPVPLNMYEMNLSTLSGSITQAALNSYVSSLGAGLAVTDAMLQQMRQGVLAQNLWNLSQYNFVRPDGSTAYLWGAVVDMGVTNQRRPQFLTLQMANQAIGTNATMLQTIHSGADPTWNQPLLNTVQLAGAHYLQSFAFASGSTTSLIVFNLHRTAALPVTFSGANAPAGAVQLTLLTSPNLTDTNEASEVISPVISSIANFDPSAALSLPPYSMTTLTWTAGSSAGPAPAPVITSIAAGNITGTSATVTWTTDQASSSQVEYGTTAGYGSLSPSNSSLVTAHSVALSGLTPGTTYNYAVISAAATSANFTFVTSPAAAIAAVGGARNNTGASTAPTSLSIGYGSKSGNTIVAVCALGSTTSSITSINDSGSNWSLRAYANSGTVRSEIWSTMAGGSVASTSFVINISGGTPASCALEEYSGVLALGGTANAIGNSGTWSVSLNTHDANNYVVAGIGANSFYGFSNPTGIIRQAGSITSNAGNNYVEMDLFDNTAATASSVTSGVITASAPWAATALELRSTNIGAPSLPAISAVSSSGITSTAATITWTTDQASSSQVEYGTTTAYGSLSAAAASPVTSHSVALTGLAPGTTYNYAALSSNSAGTATSTNFTFSTPASTPASSAIASSGITNTSATITWTTDQPSSSQIEYGTTPGYGSLSALNSSLVISHSATLTGLAPGTIYNYAVLSSNAAGTATSANFTFSTSAAVPVISAVGSSGITTTFATITWNTDQATTSQVEFGPTVVYGSLSVYNGAFTTSHSVMLSGLIPGTTYNYAALSTNAGGSLATSSNVTFTTTPAPPAIKSVAVSSVTATSATITWTTDQPSTSQVASGTTTAYGLLSALNPTLVTSHSVNLTGLAPGTTYDYQALSTNSAGLSNASPNASFITASGGPPPSVQSVSFWGVTGNSIIISWSTDQPSTTSVQYGITTALGQTSPLQTALTQSHGLTLSGLASGTTYYFVAQSTNASNSTGYSAVYSFQTLDTTPPVISNIQVSPANNHTAVVTWSVSKTATNQVEYGSNTFYGLWASGASQAQNAVIPLGWVPSGTIHYRLHSTDPAGNQTTSPDYTFTEP